MKLSIIIVNYNVKHFLEQCLYSVQKALKNIHNAEIFVVDNNSVDGSCTMMREKFPDIHLIENKKNIGFARANNQAIKLAKGEYILILNPDTIVEEDTFEKIIDFMAHHPDAGVLGVKMIDGKGNFLPESKRALPTPTVAFYKIFGLSKLFPKSKTFNKYHLGYLNKEEIHQVEVLSGAFMLIRKKTLEKTGIFDEKYFMYGEDIDLSYRILKAGYKNYYFPKTTIIHYKGESTKKGSINYVLLFYNAMIIFAKKHFSRKNAKLFSFLINTAVYFRAFLSIVKRFIRNFFLPVLDAVTIFIGYFFIKPYWEHYKFPEGGVYPDEYLLLVVPAYLLIWLISIYLIGGYKRPVKISNLIKGLVSGTLLILIIYALLPENLRFSRALILIGAAWAIISLTAIRIILHLFDLKDYKLSLNTRKKIIIVGKTDEALKVNSLLKKTEIKPDLIGFVSPVTDDKSKYFIGKIEQLREIVKINKVEEIIFCAKSISAQNIIKNMLKLSDVQVNYKIAHPESLSIIGSDSINTTGDLYVININSIAKDINKQNKRLLDIIVSLLLLILSPVIIFIVKNFRGFIKNIFKVLFGLHSWVGYYIKPGINTANLPEIKKGILTPLDTSNKKNIPNDVIERINMLYAKDYKLLNDLSIIFKGIKHLGR